MVKMLEWLLVVHLFKQTNKNPLNNSVKCSTSFYIVQETEWEPFRFSVMLVRHHISLLGASIPGYIYQVFCFVFGVLKIKSGPSTV